MGTQASDRSLSANSSSRRDLRRKDNQSKKRKKSKSRMSSLSSAAILLLTLASFSSAAPAVDSGNEVAVAGPDDLREAVEELVRAVLEARGGRLVVFTNFWKKNSTTTSM